MHRTLRGLLPVLFLLAVAPAFGQTTISGLPAATLPLGGTEAVPLVQSGITKQAPASAFGGGGSGCTFANPTATIGASAVNGVATTCMRSDAAPALPSTLPALNGSALTNLNASAIASGSVPAANLPTATTGALGAVKVDGTSITISGGIISATTGGSGTVSTTGSPATGNLTKFSGPTAITNADVSGDCTTSGTLAITCTKTSGSAFGTAATQNTGTSGATIPLLNGTNTWSGVQSINSSDLALKGSSSGSTVVNAAATASGILTLPAATDTLVGRATTDTLTGKTIAGASNTLTVRAASDITGTLPVANGGTGITSLGTGVATALGVNVGSAGAPVVLNGAGGTPSSITLTNGTGLPASGLSATGTQDSSHALFGDNTWKTVAGSGTVTSVATGACLTGGTITTTGTLSGTYAINAQTGTTYTVVSGDACKLVTYNNASAVAVTLPQATGSFGAGWSHDAQNLGAGTVTYTPTTSMINGASTLTIAQNKGCSITSDGTNYQVSACTALGAGTGTVTSVALASASNVACVVSGSPVTTSGTLTCTPAGTSGGVPYFSSSSALASSAALTANLPVIGGGAGAAPAVGTRSGNTTAFVTTTGSQTSGDCVKIDASGNHIANGAGCVSLAGTNTWTGPQSNGETTLSISTTTYTLTGATNNYYILLTSACASAACTLANSSGGYASDGTIEVCQPASGGPAAFGTYGTDYLFAGATSTITYSTAANACDLWSYHKNHAGKVVLAVGSQNPTH